jgi:hypothetical protein
VEVIQAGVDDRVLAIRVAPNVTGVAIHLAIEDPMPPQLVGESGLALTRIEPGVVLIAIDALEGDEPVGRLDAGGVAHLRLSGGQIVGRSGSGHGLAAGFGAGRWTADMADAAFEAGYEPRLPGWVPDGLARGDFHVEPDLAYPFAPPSIAVAWGREPKRVLVRQTPAPLASPIADVDRTETVTIGAKTGELMTRGRFATLVWETDERAFGVQVQGSETPGEIALRVARSL